MIQNNYLLFYSQVNQFYLFVRPGDLQSFVLKVEVPDIRNETCLYEGFDSNNSSISAHIQLCPHVVRL